MPVSGIKSVVAPASSQAPEQKVADPAAPPATPAPVQVDGYDPKVLRTRADREANPIPLSIEEINRKLFFASGTGPKFDYAKFGSPRNIDIAFEQIASTSSGVGQVRRLTDNVMSWNMKWDLVTKAKKTFDFSYYTIERDSYGKAYLGALLYARIKGVEITGGMDYLSNSRGHGFTDSTMGVDYLQELVNPLEIDGKDVPPVTLGVYNDYSNRIENFLTGGLSYQLLSANHDKFAVADKMEGETGGRNVARLYHQDPKDGPTAWRDDSIQIKGKVSTGLINALHRELVSPATELIKPDLYNFNKHATEMLGSYSLMESWTKAPPLTAEERASLGLPKGGPALSDADKKLLRDPARQKLFAEMLLNDALKRLQSLPGVPDEIRKEPLSSSELDNLNEQALELINDLELRGSRERYDNLPFVEADVKVIDQIGAASAAVGERYNEMAPGLLHLMRGAQKEIVIENPYVVLTEEMVQAFEEASKRGVKISIVTNSPASTDSIITQGYFLNSWKNVLARVPTARIFVAMGERKFHTKAFVIDGKVSGDTSYNADLLSGLVNSEIGAITRSEANAQDLIQAIGDDLKDPANKFSEWKIKRDAQGTVLRDEKGDPIADRGPEHDVSQKLQRLYKPVQFLCDLLTNTDLGSPLALPR